MSVLNLSEDERSVLSGSWDKTIVDWDLNTGNPKRTYGGSAGQISAIEPRPLSTLPVPPEIGVKAQTNGTFSSNNAAKPKANGDLPNGTSANNTADGGNEDVKGEDEDAPADADDMNSLFGDDDDAMAAAPSLALDGETAAEPPSMPGLEDDDDEFSRAIANGIQEEEDETQQDLSATDGGGAVQPPDNTSTSQAPAATQDDTNQDDHLTNGVSDSSTATNGLPHSEETSTTMQDTSMEDSPPTSDSTFMDAAIDGTIRVWDRRSPNPIARIVSSSPWCMNACWSPDGNYIYAGRRNGTVDEYNLHKGLREPNRTFKFPGGSGAVSAVRAMPNGRHLIW